MGKHGKPVTVTRYLRQSIGVDHPLADEKGMAYQHRFVLYEKMEGQDGLCHWCAKEVKWFGTPKLVADHLDDEKHRNDPDNLVPSCRNCNSNRAKRPTFFTHCIRGHEYTEENTYYRKDTGTKQCRTCGRENDRLRRKK